MTFLNLQPTKKISKKCNFCQGTAYPILKLKQGKSHAIWKFKCSNCTLEWSDVV